MGCDTIYKIKSIVNTYRRKSIRTNIDAISDEILQLSGISSDDITEHAYCLLHATSNICWYNKKKKFLSITRGYEGCRRSCQCSMDKKRASIQEKYGVDNISKLDNIKEKKRQTHLKNHGTESPLTSPASKEAMIRKYGVDNPSKSADLLDRKAKNNIEKYGVSTTLLVPEVKEKISNTIEGKYGVEYISQSPQIKEKKKKTFMNRYGVDNPFKSSDVRDKIKRSNIQKYGTEWAIQRHLSESDLNLTANDLHELNKTMSLKEISQVVGYSHSHIHKMLIAGGFKSIIHNHSLYERDIAEFLESYTIQAIQNSKEIISPFELDFYIPDFTLAIEFNGSYWHSELNGKNRTYHLNKTLLCEQNNIRLIHIWEHEWIRNQDLYKSLILTATNNNTVIYGRRCTIVALDNNTVCSFMNQNHIQGFAPAAISIGLMFDGELVACMTFGKSRYSRKYEYELIRFCNKRYTHVIGGASKIFKHFLKEFSPKTIISYCDRSLFDGIMYKKLGFRFSHFSSPAYLYTKDHFEFESRLKYQKHKLSKILDAYNPQKTEWENMVDNGYDRIWNSGQSVWVFDKNRDPVFNQND